MSGPRRRHSSEVDIVDVVPCAWCGEPRPRTLKQQRDGVKCHPGACAIRWMSAHAPRSLQAARTRSGAELGKRRGRVVRDEGCQIAVEALMADLKRDEESFFLRPEEEARLRKAIARGYSKGYQNAWKAAWQKYRRQARAGQRGRAAA